MLKAVKRAPLSLFCTLLSVWAALFIASCTEGNIAEHTPAPLAPLTQPAAEAAAEVDEGTPFEPKALGIVPGATTSELRFTWYGGSGVNRAWIRLFSNGSLVSVTRGTSGTVPAKTGTCGDPPVNCDNPQMSWHKAAVTGLTPATAYEYSVSNDSTNWSHRKTFKTPGSGPFTFAAVADPQITRGAQDSYSSYYSADRTAAGGWRETVAKIAERGADFIVGAGDQVEDYRSVDEMEYELFFSPPGMQSLPYAPVMGNHDLHIQFVYHFNFPNIPNPPTSAFSIMTPGALSYYYLYNNVLFVALNTAPYPSSTTDAVRYVNALSTVLANAKTAHSGRYDWLIVHHHRSTHSQAAQAAAADLGYWVKAGLDKIMEDHGVDIVISGHDHAYTRSHVITTAGTDRAGVINRDATSADNKSITLDKGTVHFGLNTASGVKYYPLYMAYDTNTEFPYLRDGTVGSANHRQNNPTWAANVALQNRIPTYSLFEVNGKTIIAKTFRVNNDATPIDEVTITKPSSTSVRVLERVLGE